MAHNVHVLTKKLEETKIDDDIFSGKDLSHEQNFLNAVTEKFGKEFICEETIVRRLEIIVKFLLI